MHDAAGVGSVHIDKRKHLPVGRGCKVKTPNSRSSNHLGVEMRAEKPTPPAEINDRKLYFSQGPLPAAISSKPRFYILLTPLAPLLFKAEVCVRVSHEFRYAVATGSSNQSALHGLGGVKGGQRGWGRIL